MADGSWRRAADVRAGDRLRGRRSVNRVLFCITKLLRDHAGGSMLDIEGVRVTGDHLMLTHRGWAVADHSLYARTVGRNRLPDTSGVVRDLTADAIPAHCVLQLEKGDALCTLSGYRALPDFEWGGEADEIICSPVVDGDGTMVVAGGRVVSAGIRASQAQPADLRRF